MNTLITGELPTTLQGFYDNAWRWAHKPDFKKSKHKSRARCLYRTEDNTNACFIGCSIPDRLYCESFEATALPSVLTTLGVEAHVAVSLWALQLCHDKSAEVDAMKDKLRLFAKNHNLTIPTE